MNFSSLDQGSAFLVVQIILLILSLKMFARVEDIKNLEIHIANNYLRNDSFTEFKKDMDKRFDEIKQILLSVFNENKHG